MGKFVVDRKNSLFWIATIVLVSLVIASGVNVFLVLHHGRAAYWILGKRVVILYYAHSLMLFLLFLILLVSVRMRHSGQAVRPLQEAVLVFSAIMIVYLGNNRALEAVDTVPATYIPVSILRDGNLYLDKFQFLYRHGAIPSITFEKGHWVSSYPVGAAVMAVPFYLPSALGPVPGGNPIWAHLQKLPAASFVALSAVIMLFALRRVTSRTMSFIIVALYAFGTSSLSVSSQALWQHGAGQLALAAAIYCLMRSEDAVWAAAAGFAMAIAVVCRPTNAVLLFPAGLYLLLHHPKRAGWAILAALPPVALQIWYNHAYFDAAFRTQFSLTDASLWATPFWFGLAGILFSPGRGLFVYSPFLLFSLAGMALVWVNKQKSPEQILLRYLSVGIVLTLCLYSKWTVWWGGETFGPRLLADLLPVFALFLFPLEALLQSRIRRTVFILFSAVAVTIHAIGAFAADPRWCALKEIDRHPERLWSWSDNQFMDPVKYALIHHVLPRLGYKTSQDSPELLSATYSAHLLPVEPQYGLIHFTLRATNSGKAIWLAGLPEDGGVFLDIRWQRKSDEAVVKEKSIQLASDVLPGQIGEFDVYVHPPRRHGNFILELGLRAGDRPFSDNGSPPMLMHVSVKKSVAVVLD